MARDDEQVDRVLEIVADVLGANVLGVYLFGSAVVGGLKPASDLDILVVLGRQTTTAEKQVLVDRLRSISSPSERPASWRPVELTTVVQSDVRPWRYPPAMDFQYGEWLRSDFDAGAIAPPAANADLAVLLTMVHTGGRPLIGPPPMRLLDPVPATDLQRAMRDGVDGLLADLDTDTTNVVLTLARIWSTVTDGQLRSKGEAADWALDRLPPALQAVVARARAIYLGDERDHWDDLSDQVRPFAEYVVAQT